MNKKEIIQIVEEQIDPEDIKYLIWHGNRSGRDIDLLIVLERKTEVRLCQSSKLKLDILMISKGEFKRRLRLLDPVITEPLITGVLLSDNNEIEFGNLRGDTLRSGEVLSLSPSKKAIQFLKRKAKEKLKKAEALLEEGDEDSLLPALIEISYACSYGSFAEYYGDSPKFFPITFDGLLAINGQSFLKEVMGVLEAVKSGRKLGKDEVIDLFEKTQKLLEAI